MVNVDEVDDGRRKPDQVALEGAATGHARTDVEPSNKVLADGARPRPALAKRKRRRTQPLGMSPWLWSTYNTAVVHREHLERAAWLTKAVALPVAVRALPSIQPLETPPLLPLGSGLGAWPRLPWLPVLDLLRGMPMWPADSGITLLTNQFRALWRPIHESVAWRLDLWSGYEDLPGQVLLAEARLVRSHLLSEHAADLTPVEEFAFESLGYARPARDEDRQALLDAVIDVLLGDDWHVAPAFVHDVLRKGVTIQHRITRPHWRRQVNGRPVMSYNALLTHAGDPSGATLIDLLPALQNVESEALDRVCDVHDPAVRFLMSSLTVEEMVVVRRFADGEVTWPQAALLCGLDERTGENLRRKVRRLVGQYQQRRQARGSEFPSVTR